MSTKLTKRHEDMLWKVRGASGDFEIRGSRIPKTLADLIDCGYVFEREDDSATYFGGASVHTFTTTLAGESWLDGENYDVV